MRKQAAEGAPRPKGPREQARETAEAARARRLPARFSHLYESRDGALCLFEDEFGHLHAVDSSRLA